MHPNPNAIKDHSRLSEEDLHLSALRYEICAGFEAVERGEFTDYDACNLQQLEASVKERRLKRMMSGDAKPGAK